MLVAAMPMYDWPECRAANDARWARLRDHLRAQGIAAPERLARRNGDLPPVPGGIRDAQGAPIAPDPAELPPEEFDLAALWHHPDLLLSETCWGPMELGLEPHVAVVGQFDYGEIEGCRGPDYSSALVMRKTDGTPLGAPSDGRPRLDLELLAGLRLAFNERASLSGHLSLARDLAACGADMSLFSARVETGAHRASVRAVAERRADVAAVDARSWSLARRFDPAAGELHVVGWTARRRGIAYIGAPRFSVIAPHLNGQPGIVDAGRSPVERAGAA